MARHGSVDVTFSVEDGPGGSAQAMKGHITSEVAAEIIAMMEEVTTFGDASKKFDPTGMSETPPFTVSGPWNETGAAVPHTVFIAPDDGPGDDDREVVMVFGNGKTFTVQTRLSRFKVMGNVGPLTKYEAEFQPNGVGVWSG